MKNFYDKLAPDKKWMKGTLFVLVNAVILVAMYFIIKNFSTVSGTIGKGINVVSEALWPLILGVIIAYLIDPLVGLFERSFMKKLVPDAKKENKKIKRLKLRRGLSILLAFISILLIIVILIIVFTSLIIGKIEIHDINLVLGDIMDTMKNYESSVETWVQSNLPEGIISDKVGDALKTVMQWVTEHFSFSSVVTFFISTFGGVFNTLIAMIMSVYLLLDKERFKKLCRRAFDLIITNKKTNETLVKQFKEADIIVSNFIKGILIDASIIAFLSSIGLYIIGLKYAVLVGILAGLFNVIPYFGPILGMVPAFLVGLFTGNITTAILSIAVLFAIQQIDGNLIYPKVVGGNTGLHPLTVLLAVSIGGYCFNLVGMIVAVPCVGIIILFLKPLVLRREKKIALKRAAQDELNTDGDEDGGPCGE